jgi:hypothetical protein
MYVTSLYIHSHSAIVRFYFKINIYDFRYKIIDTTTIICTHVPNIPTTNHDIQIYG